MSTQTVTGFAVTSQGGIPLETSLTDGSDSQELKTDASYTVTSQGIGRFAEGATLTHLKVNAATGIAYAGILRNGAYVAVCQSLGSLALGGQSQTLPVLPGPVSLLAGDQLIVRCEA